MKQFDKTEHVRFSDMATPNLDELRKELRIHYAAQWALNGKRHPVEKILDAYDSAHPGLNAYQLKGIQYEILAENLQTLVFADSPFYFVTDSCRGPQAGIPYYGAGGWLLRRNEHLCRDANPQDYDLYTGMQAANLYGGSHIYFDFMHYCYSVTNVVKHGLRYYYEKAQAALAECKTDEERDFLQCAIAGLKAVKRISERFADTAQVRLDTLTDPRQRRFMQMIADSARRVPWEKPDHFYEGLNTMWFCRDLMGEIDGIGNSHLGRPDYILYDLYQNDLESGYINREDAYDLVSRFLTHGDCQYDKDSIVEKEDDHELEMGFVLGGCDPQGNEIYNEVTTMFIYAHRAQKLIYPKPHYRFGADSPQAYMHDIAYDFVHGRSVAGLVNDDSIIPVLVEAGKSLEDARCYINYGCWGIVVEGMENTTGGNFMHLLSALERTVYGDNDICRKIGMHFDTIDNAKSFEEVYTIYYANMIRVLKKRLQLVGKHGGLGVKVNPIPLFSAFVDGCLENKKDCLAGGSKYTVNEFALAEMSNTVDGLLAIKTLCFEKKVIGLHEFLDAVRSNWEGCDSLRCSLMKCPHFGDESPESMGLTKRLFEDICRDTHDISNEFGTRYLVDLFVYQAFRFLGERVRATPDGRRDGEVVATGVNPTRFHAADPLPGVLNSINAIDPDRVQTHSVMLQLPAGKMDIELMTSILRSLQKLKMKHIQINCVDPEVLLDAQKHPELHQDLIVRVVGFSARFVSLSPEWQDEFIHRVMYQA